MMMMNVFLKCSLHLYHANQFVVMMMMMVSVQTLKWESRMRFWCLHVPVSDVLIGKTEIGRGLRSQFHTISHQVLFIELLNNSYLVSLV